MRKGAIAIFAGLVAGCVTKAKDGSTVVDLRGCQSTSKAKEQPALRDGSVTMEIRGAKTAIASAVAWGVHEEQAVHVLYSAGALRCDQLRLSTDGVVVVGNASVGSLRLAPVMIEERTDQRDAHFSVVPKGDTWQVVEVSAPLVAGVGADRKPTFFGTTIASSVDPARGAAAKGRRTKVRVAVEVGGDRLSGTLDLEGCGEISFKRPPRLQPRLDFRVADRRPTIRGATYRKLDNGEYELRLTSAPADCGGTDPGDVDVTLSRDRIVMKGDLFATAYNYFGHGLSVTPSRAPDGGGVGAEADGGAVAQIIKLDVRGVFRRPMQAELDPRGDLEARDYSRHVHLSGEVDALECPPVR